MLGEDDGEDGVRPGRRLVHVRRGNSPAKIVSSFLLYPCFVFILLLSPEKFEKIVSSF